MNPNDRNDIVIAGAGPTGMVLAIELARRGVGFRLIDRKQEPTETSRSFTLHAKTMEMFEHMGLAHRFLEDGILSRGFIFNFKGKEERPALDFTTLKTRYPYILVYNQNDTEARLRDHLLRTYNVQPEWGTRLAKLDAREGGFDVVLAHDDDRRESLSPTWVLGCDGVHSFVRKRIGADFDGENYAGMVMQMMDVGYPDFPETDDWVHYYISKESFLLVTRLPDGNHRVLISDMGEADNPDLTPREAFQQLIDGHIDDTHLSEPKWATKWTLWKRLATTYREGNAFLVGDAAHVHSPSGGQGMNAGMQDAFNLGWKLALVQRGEAEPSLLDSYEVERKPIGAQVIAGTDAMHDIIMAHGKGVEDRIELTQAPTWHDDAVNRISGLSYNYRDATQLPDGVTPDSGVTPGDRAPDAALGNSVRLFDLIGHPKLTLLVVDSASGDMEACKAVCQEVNNSYGASIRCSVIGQGEKLGERTLGPHADSDGQFAAAYGTPDSGHLYLIRPDGYVAFHGTLEQRDQLMTYLNSFLVAQQSGAT